MKNMAKLIIYQVFPRYFGNSQRNSESNADLKRNGTGKFKDFSSKALNSIKELGVTHIWYTGVLEHATQSDYSAYGIQPDPPELVKGKAGSPYAIKDYYDVCPDLAESPAERLTEFKNLLRRTHKAGLKALIDFVPNHLARTYHADA
ncbi:MAG: alpha-amylase family glycosyl hydrolase, partial [Bacteroidales bacterium]